MTTEQINKAIREEAEKRYPDHEESLSRAVERYDFIEGAKFGLSIKPSTNLEQQNENERLNNSEGKILVEARRLIDMRDAIVTNDYEAVYHILYSIASPNFDKLDPWEELEEIAYFSNPNPSTELKAEEKIQELNSTNKPSENI